MFFCALLCSWFFILLVECTKYLKIVKTKRCFYFGCPASDRARRGGSMWCGHLSRGGLHSISWSFLVLVMLKHICFQEISFQTTSQTEHVSHFWQHGHQKSHKQSREMDFLNLEQSTITQQIRKKRVSGPFQVVQDFVLPPVHNSLGVTGLSNQRASFLMIWSIASGSASRLLRARPVWQPKQKPTQQNNSRPPDKKPKRTQRHVFLPQWLTLTYS